VKYILIFFIICIFIPSLSSTLSFPGEIYRWVDEKGIVHFSDSPIDKSKLESYGTETIHAFDYVEDVTQANEEIEEKAYKKEQPQKTQSTKIKESIKPNKKYDINTKGNNTYVKKRKSRSKSLNKLSRSYNATTNRTFSRRTYKGYDKKQRQIDDNNIKIRKRNEQIQRENEARRQEYEKERKKVERHNAQVKEYNAQLNNDVESQGPFMKREPKRVKYRGRKPYLGKDDPNRPFYQRHPLARGSRSRGSKPYLGKDNPGRTYLRRHPAVRGWD